MVTHMKTTIEIADGLLEEARRVAAREKTTVRALVEDGLRRALADRKKKGAFKLRLVTFGGDGLNPNIPADLPRRLAYDDEPEAGR
jgi:hypothetical protein